MKSCISTLILIIEIVYIYINYTLHYNYLFREEENHSLFLRVGVGSFELRRVGNGFFKACDPRSFPQCIKKNPKICFVLVRGNLSKVPSSSPKLMLMRPNYVENHLIKLNFGARPLTHLCAPLWHTFTVIRHLIM